MSSNDHSILMIPGPTEYHPDVLATLALPSLSHTSPQFIAEFSELLENFKRVLGTKNGQPLIVSGSGTLGWDIIAANLCEKNDRALVINTGYFSDSYATCCETYGIKVDQVCANQIGASVELSEIEKKLKEATADGVYKLICITQVDTSTAVLNDVKSISQLCKQLSPTSLISVDGVCSFGGERFAFDDWKIDAAMTCSQKALGAPPGLALLMFSQQSIDTFRQRTTPVPTYYANLNNWLPIMDAYANRKPSYFATPNVNLIRSLNTSLKLLLDIGIENIVRLHEENAQKFRNIVIKSFDLKFVPTTDKNMANTLSAIYYPKEMTDEQRTKFLGLVKESQVVIAGGLHKKIKTEYFRVGHMGYSVWGGQQQHVVQTLKAIEKALKESGHKINEIGKEDFLSFSCKTSKI